jgi:hypothetical protein
MAFEVLHPAFMRLGLQQRGKGPQVAAFARFWVFLARVQAVLAGFQFTNQGRIALFIFERAITKTINCIYDLLVMISSN